MEVLGFMWEALQELCTLEGFIYIVIGTLAGVVPVMTCSRLDLFHTGETSTPSARIFSRARNWAEPCLANLSPTPKEYFGRMIIPVSYERKVKMSMRLEKAIITGNQCGRNVFLYRPR